MYTCKYTLQKLISKWHNKGAFGLLFPLQRMLIHKIIVNNILQKPFQQETST